MTDHNNQNQHDDTKKINYNYSIRYNNPNYDYDLCSYLVIVIGYCFMIVTFPVLFFLYLRIARHYERAVIFRLGRLRDVKGPGLFYVLPIIDRYKRVDLRLISFQVPMQEVLSKDMVSCELDGCVFHRICDPVEAVITLENSKASMKLLAQSLLRSVVSTKTIAEILPGREIISKQTQSLFDQVTQNWGIKIERFEIKNIHLPAKLRQSLAAETEASHDSQAKLIAAESEILKSESLSKAARILENPAALQLRYLQSLDAIGADHKANNIIWPLPQMDIIGESTGRKHHKPEATSPSKIPRKEKPATYGNYNLFQSTTPVNPQQAARLPTPPVTSTMNSAAVFARPHSASLTEICSTDEEEPIQKPTQTPVYNYVH